MAARRLLRSPSAVEPMAPLPAFLLLYAAMYAAFGVASPLWPRFFETRGLSPEELGTLLGLGMLARLISGPMIGRIADVSGYVRAAFAICAALAAAFALALLAARAFWLLLLVHVAHAAALAPITSTADALAVNAARGSSLQSGFEYGWVRGTASAAFIVGTLSMGQLLVHADISAIAWMHAACLAVAVGTAALIPTLQPAEQSLHHASYLGGVRELWRIPVFRFVILVAGLVYGSHAVHDAFAVIRWNAAGVGPEIASVLWSEAVAAEIVVFVLIGPALVRWLGPHRAAVLAATAGVVRWIVASQTTSVVALAMIQPLHGLTFALLHLACMRLIGNFVPVHLAATAQALYAFASGLATAILTIVSGRLYAGYGGEAFLLMALLCAVALPVAWYGLRAPER
jgi:PPP family 3-phenylpropionic acid transporter